MDDNLWEKFTVGQRRGTEGRGEGHPEQREQLEPRPEG